MAELDQAWIEIHDAEQRLGVVEQTLATIAAQRADQASAASAGRDGRRFWITVAISVVSTVAFVLSLLTQLGVRI